MKYVLFALSVSLSILIACNNNKKPGEITVTSEDGKTTTSAEAGNLAMTAEAVQKKGEELQKLSPYTLDQMKSFLPEQLAGSRRSKFSANAVMGTAYAEAEYQLNDSAEIKLNLFDCAGQAGAGIYNTQFITMMSIQSESDDEYIKTIDFDGSKAIEQVKKDGSRATLHYLAADRLLVTLEGRNTGIGLLKKTAGSLKLK